MSLMSLFGDSVDMPGRVRRKLALTPACPAVAAGRRRALSPPPSAVALLRRTGGERENFRALFETPMASVASVALLPFRPEGAPTPGRAGFHKRRERLPLSWGRGPG